MDNIRIIARAAVLKAKVVPEENVLTDVLEPDWDGSPMVLINCDPSIPEDDSQFGHFTETTILYITGISPQHGEAGQIGDAAGNNVYQYFCTLAYFQSEGILCIELIEKSINQLADRNVFRSNYTFKILHKAE